jgi:hypothetical protein
MKKSVIAGVAIIVAAVSAFAFAQNRTSSDAIKASQVLTWDCELSEFQPESIMITCGDGGMYISDIKWSTWSSTGATGTATYNVNNCDPDCADGTMLNAPVTLQLSNLVTYKGKHYLRTMDITSTDGSALPQSDSDTYKWDVMEFAEMMNNN